MQPSSWTKGFISMIFILILISSSFHLWKLAGIILPLLLIFFYSISSEEIGADQIAIKRWISRNKTEEKGELIFAKLTIKNIGKRIPRLEIVDKIPDICTVNEGSNHWLLELEEDEEITLSYAFQCHKRGRFALGPVLVKTSDIFHFHSEIKQYPVISSFSVVPSLLKFRNLPIVQDNLLPESGNIPSRLYKGRDFDFQGVRAYSQNDELRTINWRITAKFDELHTNEYAFDQAARIFVIFDHTTSARRVLEEGVMATLSTSEFLISLRNKVGFFGIGEFVEEIPAAPGKRQLLRINEYLIDAQGSFPSHKEVFKLRLYKKLLPALPPSGAQIFLISPLYHRDLLDFLLETIKRGHNVTLILPRLESIAEMTPNASKASQLANSLLLLERKFVMRHVDKLGIPQIHWYPMGPKIESIKLRRTK
ncbi:MAG: DUF58 domain-containing protein [Candidatus Hodarchaeales archaeon]